MFFSLKVIIFTVNNWKKQQIKEIEISNVEVICLKHLFEFSLFLN